MRFRSLSVSGFDVITQCLSVFLFNLELSVLPLPSTDFSLVLLGEQSDFLQLLMQLYIHSYKRHY